MTWLAPMAGLIVALSTVPPLVALYFLRLRRTRRTVSSTMLWRRATEDLHANTPFQRLRFSLLLILQLLALALVVLALAQPQADLGFAQARRVVLLIDASASMGTTDASGGGSRLDEARRLARDRVSAMHAGGFFRSTPPSIMVIAFAREARIVCPFTDNEAQLLAAIAAIAQTDETTRIADAFELARAFTTVTDPDNAAATPAEPPAYEVFSDGEIADAAQCALRSGEEVLYRRLGSADEPNAGIAAIAVARTPERPEEVEVFVRVVNWGAAPRQTDVELRVDGSIRAVTPSAVIVPPMAAGDANTPTTAGEAQVVFPAITLPAGGVVTASLLAGDRLKADDRASVVASPPDALRVALVGRGTFILRGLLEAMPLKALDTMTLEAWNELVVKDPQTPELYDAVVLDMAQGVSADRGHYLSFGTPPPIAGIVPFASKSNAVVRSLREGHPLLQFVNLDDLFVSSMSAVAPGSEAEVIVEASEGPLVVTVAKGPLAAVCVTFDPMESNWPFQRGFVNFVANALEWLAAGGRRTTDEPLTPGDVASVQVPLGAKGVRVTPPDGTPAPPATVVAGEASFGPLRRSGTYTITWESPSKGDTRTSATVAVDMDARDEGRIASVERLGLAASSVAQTAVTGAARNALWPWLLVGAIVTLLLEWWVWLRRV